MAWTITNWANADWSAAAILNEFVGAVNERKSALGQGLPFATVNVGDDVQSKSLFVAIQGWIESYRHHFVVSHDTGTPRGGGYFDGKNGDPAIDWEVPPIYANLAAVFSAAGLAHSNWRRYTTHPDEAGVAAYGQMQAGDIIGPWIFEDIQKCLNVLVWTRKTPYSCTAVNRIRYYGEGSAVLLADARALAVANYTSVAAGATVKALSYNETSYPGWRALLEHDEGNYQTANVWDGIARSADWYVYGKNTHSPSTVWDDYGDSIIEDKLALFSQDDPATVATTIVSGQKLGTAATMPNTPWCAAADTASRGWWLGSISSNVSCVIRWNVTGGFTYA